MNTAQQVTLPTPAWVAILIAAIAAAGGITLGIAALRKVQPESQKLVLEGRSAWTLAETNYFDKLAERQDAESLRLRTELNGMRARIDKVEILEVDLKHAQDRAVEAEKRAIIAERRADAAERHAVAAESRADALERRALAAESHAAGLERRLDDLQAELQLLHQQFDGTPPRGFPKPNIDEGDKR